MHFVFYLLPKQGDKIEGVVLNRVRVSSPQPLTYTQVLVEHPPGLNTNSPEKLTLELYLITSN